MMTKRTIRLFTVMAALSSAGAAYAQEASQPYSDTLPQGLSLTVGAGIGYSPEYLGSDDYHAVFLPMIKAEYGDTFFLNINGVPYSGKDTAGMNLLKGEHYKAGVSIGYMNGRDAGDNGHLTGLGDVDWTLEGNIFASFDYNNFFVNGEFGHDLLGEHEGFVGSLEAGYGHLFTRQLKGVLSVSADYGSEDFSETYFGVNAVQSAASGLDAYSPEGGIYKSGVNGTLTYKLTPGAFVQGSATYSRMAGDAKDSPINRDKNQWFLGTSVGYSF